MLDRENAGPALGSRAVDAAFWALVCEDEEWLCAEFEAIVSEPRETPTRSAGRPSKADAARPGGAAPLRRAPEAIRHYRAGDRPVGGGAGNARPRSRRRCRQKTTRIR